MTLKELQSFSIEICSDIHRFCQENGIRYFLAYGSLLGAIRHKGFIPWDDDMDIMMLRPDYDRFISTYSSDRFELVSSSNTEDCWLAFSRVCDTRRTECRCLIPWHGPSRKTGLWVDIFPLDAAPEDSDVYHKRYSLLNFLYNSSIDFRKARTPKENAVSLKWCLKIFLQTHFHPNRKKMRPEDIVSFIHDVIGLEPWSGTGRVAQMCCADSEESIFDVCLLAETELIDFDGEQFCVPKQWDRVLTQMFGDYMKLPPAELRRPLQHKHFEFYWK